MAIFSCEDRRRRSAGLQASERRDPARAARSRWRRREARAEAVWRGGGCGGSGVVVAAVQWRGGALASFAAASGVEVHRWVASGGAASWVSSVRLLLAARSGRRCLDLAGGGDEAGVVAIWSRSSWAEAGTPRVFLAPTRHPVADASGPRVSGSRR